MKKALSCLITGLCLIASITSAQIASQVSWFYYPTSLPNSDNTAEFGTARDNLLTGMKFGGSAINTGTRSGTSANNVTAIEIRNVFDATDIMVSTNTPLWRGVFNPTTPFNAQYGNRAYAPVILVGKNGKVCIDRLSYRVTCGSIPLLGNNSSLSTLPYSVSRIGINAGPDGILFTPDDVIINSGAGTNLVDAIAFIGGRIGTLVNSQTDINTLNAAIGSGTWVKWEYQFVALTNTQASSITIPLYQSGSIPWSAQYNRLVPFIGPNGVLFSIVGQPGSTGITIAGSRNVVGPYSTVTTTATEGTSVFWSFTRNPTNDFGFYRLWGNNPS